MPTITITYDAENSIAQKTIDYIVSLGVFHVEKSEITKSETNKNELVKSFKTALTEANQIKQEIKQGSIKGLTIEEMLNEI